METAENKKYGTYYIAFLDMLGFSTWLATSVILTL